MYTDEDIAMMTEQRARVRYRLRITTIGPVLFTYLAGYKDLRAMAHPLPFDWWIVRIELIHAVAYHFQLACDEKGRYYYHEVESHKMPKEVAEWSWPASTR